MARIKITDLPVMEELGQEQLQGIYGEGIFPEGGIRKLTAAVALSAGLAGAPWVLAGGRVGHAQSSSLQQQHVQAKIPGDPIKAAVQRKIPTDPIKAAAGSQLAGQLQKVKIQNVASTVAQAKSKTLGSVLSNPYKAAADFQPAGQLQKAGIIIVGGTPASAGIPGDPVKVAGGSQLAGQVQELKIKNVGSTAGQGKSIAPQSLKEEGAGSKTPKLSKADKAKAVIAAKANQAAADKNYVDAQNAASAARGQLGSVTTKAEQASQQAFAAAKASQDHPFDKNLEAAATNAINAQNQLNDAYVQAKVSLNLADANVRATTAEQALANANLAAATAAVGKGHKE